MPWRQIFFYGFLFLGFLQLFFSFSNNAPYLKYEDKIITNEYEYQKENRKRHRVNGIITLGISIPYYFSVGDWRFIVPLVSYFALIFNFLIFNSKTRVYVKDRN
jgi:hypothetical protein